MSFYEQKRLVSSSISLSQNYFCLYSKGFQESSNKTTYLISHPHIEHNGIQKHTTENYRKKIHTGQFLGTKVDIFNTRVSNSSDLTLEQPREESFRKAFHAQPVGHSKKSTAYKSAQLRRPYLWHVGSDLYFKESPSSSEMERSNSPSYKIYHQKLQNDTEWIPTENTYKVTILAIFIFPVLHTY